MLHQMDTRSLAGGPGYITHNFRPPQVCRPAGVFVLRRLRHAKLQIDRFQRSLAGHFAQFVLDIGRYIETCVLGESECDPAAEWDAEFLGFASIGLSVSVGDAHRDADAIAPRSGAAASCLFCCHASCLPLFVIRMKISGSEPWIAIGLLMTHIGRGSPSSRTSGLRKSSPDEWNTFARTRTSRVRGVCAQKCVPGVPPLLKHQVTYCFWVEHLVVLAVFRDS